MMAWIFFLLTQGVAVGLGYFALTGRKEINHSFNQSINQLINK